MNAKLLLDANLSWRSTVVLKNYFDDCLHVDDIGLPVPAKDLDIWNYAKTNKFIIVTNDDDFLNLLLLKGFPPKIILFKTGNQSRKAVETQLIHAKEEILHFLQSEEIGLLEIIKQKNKTL